MTVTHNDIEYVVSEQLENIVAGTLCYDINTKEVYVSTDDFPADTPGLTGRNLTIANPELFL